MNGEQERYADFIRRKSAQADQQDDVRRGPFPKRYGFTCGACGSVHATQREITECRELG